jgi:hypothetical protein
LLVGSKTSLNCVVRRHWYLDLHAA